MTISEAVTKRLLELCGERGLTINKLCTLSGVTQSTVSDIVNRNTSNTGIATIKKLCDGLESAFAPSLTVPCSTIWNRSFADSRIKTAVLQSSKSGVFL